MTSFAALRLVVLVMAASAAAACTATETVTITEAARASATATAAQNAATSSEQPSSAPPSESESAPGTSASSPASAIVPGEPTCSYAGVDSYGDMQIELAFVATVAERSDSLLEYEVRDGAGQILVNSTTLVEELAPGESVRVMVDTYTNGPAFGDRDAITCSLVGVEAAFAFENYAPQPGDSCRFVEVDDFDDIQLRIAVTSPLATTSELAIDVALRGPGGVRFDNTVVYTLFVDAGEQIVHEADSFTEFPDWVDESTFSCEILSIQEF